MESTIHQEVHFEASVEDIFSAYIDAQKHAEFTGGPANIDGTDGGAFTAHNGAIEGRNIEIVNNQRIVQAWRVADWPAGVYSLIKIELKDNNGKCTLLLDHSSIPEGKGEHIDGGWHKMYWRPLKQWLANKQ